MPITRKEVLAYLKKKSLKALGPEFTALVKKTHGYRKDHKGFVPLEVFNQCVGIGGRYKCVEICTLVFNNQGERSGLP